MQSAISSQLCSAGPPRPTAGTATPPDTGTSPGTEARRHSQPVCVEIYDLLASAWQYPDAGQRDRLATLRDRLREQNARAAESLVAFLSETAQLTLADLEESFIRVFDCNPPCAPEVGWHLFGEHYDRGAFLVWMREQLRRFKLSESAELPDHITHVLPVLARLGDSEAREFSTRCVLPAVQQIEKAIETTACPNRHLVQATAAVLEADFGPARVDRRLPVNQPQPTEAMLACGICR